jgi:hypothetical protein
MLQPMPFVWRAGAMWPDPRFAQLAKRQFADGARYVLEPHDEVSHAERGHYFASVNDAWKNLSDEATARYPTPNHLRKWALVKAGWRKENFTVCDSDDRALHLAAFVRNLDDAAVVVVEKNVVRTYVARTQKIGPPEQGYMTRDEWKRSKQDVLDILSGTIGVSRKALEREGRINSP